MYRYKCILAYDGYDYMGFQIQEDLKTIELEIKKALFKMFNKDIKIYPSGRTDRHVHAIGQVIHFDLDILINPMGLKKGINSYLPQDIYIKDIEQTNMDFHARFSAKSKEYRYYINTLEHNPLTYRYMPTIYNLDVDLMIEASKLLIGVHDFKGFASSQIDERKSTIKEIYDIKVNKYEDKLEFIFIGNGFLKYQIRKMMGLLVEIGFHKRDMKIINEIFETCDPKITHVILDGCGLYLYKVNY